MKKSFIRSAAGMVLAMLCLQTQAQTPWNVTGNAISPGQFLGTINNEDVVIFVDSLPRFDFRTDGQLNWATDQKRFRINGTTHLFFKDNYNTAVGSDAGTSISTSTGNSCFGFWAGLNDIDGSENTYIGSFAGKLHTGSSGSSTGDDNTFVGAGSGSADDNGEYNTYVGARSGYLLAGASYKNTLIGMQTGANATLGDRNTALGYFAGNASTNMGSRNVFIGHYATGTAGLSNATAIGAEAQVTRSNSMVFGNDSVVAWGFGVTPGSSNIFEFKNTTAVLTTGGVWVNASDRALKENIVETDYADILSKVDRLSIPSWSYKAEKGILHIGPMAQDFYKLFKTGGNDKTVSTIDPAGVALASIKQLHKLSMQQDEAMSNLQEENEQLKNRLSQLEAQMAKLLAAQGSGSTVTPASSNIEKAALFQNVPNPFTENTLIAYAVPAACTAASINLYSQKGLLINTYKLSQKGSGQLRIAAGTLGVGNYTYELVVDGKSIDRKQLVLIR